RFATIGGVFHIHRAERADGLVASLGAVVSSPPLADPMAAEVIAVPTRGVERWLTHRPAPKALRRRQRPRPIMGRPRPLTCGLRYDRPGRPCLRSGVDTGMRCIGR